MIISWTLMFVLNGVGMLCALIFLISFCLQRAPSPYSVWFNVWFRLQRALFFFALGISAVVAAAHTFGTVVPRVGLRIGW